MRESLSPEFERLLISSYRTPSPADVARAETWRLVAAIVFVVSSVVQLGLLPLESWPYGMPFQILRVSVLCYMFAFGVATIVAVRRARRRRRAGGDVPA